MPVLVCMAMYGYIRLFRAYRAMYGYVGLWRALYGNVGQCMAV